MLGLFSVRRGEAVGFFWS